MSTPPDELSLVPIEAPKAPSVAPTAQAASSVASPHARPLGPGWFDSSFDLQRGLVIEEGWSDDALLRAWVERYVNGQRGEGGGESSSAT